MLSHDDVQNHDHDETLIHRARSLAVGTTNLRRWHGKRIQISSFLVTVLSAVIMTVFSFPANAAGLGPWQFGMSKSEVTSFTDFGPYEKFSNGDLETHNGKFHGRRENIQFFFQEDELFQIGVYLYEGTDRMGGIPAWRHAYEALQEDYGKVDMPDIQMSPKSDPVSADVKADALAIAAAATADITGRTTMAPRQQPADMQVVAKFSTYPSQGKKWYQVCLFYRQKPGVTK